MKSSVYNISVPLDNNGILVFNSFSKSFLYLSKKVWHKCFEENSDVKVDCLETKELDILKQNGFIVDDEVDEYSEALSIKMKTRLNKKTYSVIINPTLDCNLNCWYCYESHKAGSQIAPKTIESILKHLELKYVEDKFEHLELSFFGGEPLLITKEVVSIIEGASEFCDKQGVQMRISFTTNGTIIPSNILSILQNKKILFQITLDGVKEQHNSIRGFKNALNTNSYDIVWRNIRKLLSTLDDIHLCLRINFDNNTFDEYSDLVEQILSLDKECLTVSLQKVWQVNSNLINYEKVFDFINILQEHKVNVSFLDFSNGETTCYADKLNSAIINYDGSVFKCTARDFNISHSVGELIQNGDIIWNYDKLKEYSFSKIPSKCQNCKLFPSCPGICSQKIIDMGDEAPCYIGKPFSIEDYVLFNYKLKTL